jgi:hypothetical protein
MRDSTRRLSQCIVYAGPNLAHIVPFSSSHLQYAATNDPACEESATRGTCIAAMVPFAGEVHRLGTRTCGGAGLASASFGPTYGSSDQMH